MDSPPDGWFEIAVWQDCARLERPGYVFELENADGLTLQMHCEETIILPHDWATAPVRFRLIPEVPPRHSDPIPLPVTPR